MTPSDVKLAAKLLAMHTERSTILAALRTVTSDAIHVVTSFDDRALTEKINAEIDASPEQFDISAGIKQAVYDMLEKQLITELTSIEDDLTALGVPMVFRQNSSDELAAAIKRNHAELRKKSEARDAESDKRDPFAIVKDIMRQISPESAAYADAQVAKMRGDSKL